MLQVGGNRAGANICLYFGELVRGKVLKIWGRVFGTQGLASKAAKISGNAIFVAGSALSYDGVVAGDDLLDEACSLQPFILKHYSDDVDSNYNLGHATGQNKLGLTVTIQDTSFHKGLHGGSDMVYSFVPVHAHSFWRPSYVHRPTCTMQQQDFLV